MRLRQPQLSAPSTQASRFEVRLVEPEFQGPLDLLLELIKDSHFDIFDIPLLKITEQFLEKIREGMDLSTESQWGNMAARLIHLKSLTLAGKEKTGEIEEEKKILITELLEYQKFKEGADKLIVLEEINKHVLRRAPRETFLDFKEFMTPTWIPLSAFDLYEAIQKLLVTWAPEFEVEGDLISVSEKMEEILESLREKNEMVFEKMFGESPTRGMIIVTLLALLELVKVGEIELWQKKPWGEIIIKGGGMDGKSSRRNAG